MVLFLTNTAPSAQPGVAPAGCTRRIPASFFIIALIFPLLMSGCSMLKERPKTENDEFSIIGKEIPPKEAKKVLHEVGQNFAYGPGLGDTVLNVGAVVIFPPYAIYLIGNAALSLSGYEPITVSSVLPEKDGKVWSESYDRMVSGPGKVAAAMAGHEYRSRQVAEERMQTVLKNIKVEPASVAVSDRGKWQ